MTKTTKISVFCLPLNYTRIFIFMLLFDEIYAATIYQFMHVNFAIKKCFQFKKNKLIFSFSLGFILCTKITKTESVLGL